MATNNKFHQMNLKVEPRESRCFYQGNHYNAKDGYWDYNFLFGGAGGGDQSEFCQY